MTELAAHLTDHVLGGRPVRQWVLTLPHRLRCTLAPNYGGVSVSIFVGNGVPPAT